MPLKYSLTYTEIRCIYTKIMINMPKIKMDSKL